MNTKLSQDKMSKLGTSSMRGVTSHGQQRQREDQRGGKGAREEIAEGPSHGWEGLTGP